MGVIKFPDRELPPEDQRHAEAFRDLEPHIHDCVMMSQIAAQQMRNTTCNDDGLSFAVFHLHEMLLNLEKFYHAAWDGEVAAILSDRGQSEWVMKATQAKDETPPPVAWEAQPAAAGDTFSPAEAVRIGGQCNRGRADVETK